MIDNREVGRRIARLRQERGLTQMQLAAMMNVSHQAVSKWESGQAMPDIQTLLELTRFFGLTVEQITGADVREEPMATEESAEAEEAQAEPPREADEANGDGQGGKQGPEEKEVRIHMDIRQLLQMAPFMTKEGVAEIAMGMEGPLSADDIARLAPFLPQESVVELVKKHAPQFSWDSLRRLAPHLPRETVDELARSIAGGSEKVDPPEDNFNRTMNDLGRAFDDLGRGMDKAVRKALRFSGNIVSGVGSVLSEMANGAASEAARAADEARALKRQELRRKAFERALADGRWDWLGEHIDELDDGDELKRRIARRARELELRDWLDEFMGDCVDAEAAEDALQNGDLDWLGEHIEELEDERKLRAARLAIEARDWAWLESCEDEIDFGGEIESIVRAIWQGGERELAAHFAQEHFEQAAQTDALFREAVEAGDEELCELLWEEISPECARARLMELALSDSWAQVEEHLDAADGETLEKLMELAVEQGNFDAIDFLSEQL